MSLMRLSEAARALPAELRGEDRDFDAVCTDTRTLKPRALFVALKGERFDGHDFVGRAAASGAAAALVEESGSRIADAAKSLPLLVVTGLAFMVQMAATNTLIQTLVDDAKRGRAMGYFMMAFMGTAPFGSLLAGSAATRIGAPNTLIISGLVSILGALWFARSLPALRQEIRPIYVQKGILPEIASGLQDATELNVPPEG